jgi:hypothetical protein
MPASTTENSMTTTPNGPTTAGTGRPPVVDLATWQAARDELLVRYYVQPDPHRGHGPTKETPRQPSWPQVKVAAASSARSAPVISTYGNCSQGKRSVNEILTVLYE